MLLTLNDSCAHMNQSSTLGLFLPLRPKSMLETEVLQLEGALRQGQIYVTEQLCMLTLAHTVAVSPTVEWSHR